MQGLLSGLRMMVVANFCEINGTMHAGGLYPTSSQGVLFNGQSQYHATCDWHSGSRVVLVAYSVLSLLDGTAEFLQELGFVLP